MMRHHGYIVLEPVSHLGCHAKTSEQVQGMVYETALAMCSPLCSFYLLHIHSALFLPWIQFHSVTEPTAVGIALILQLLFWALWS